MEEALDLSFDKLRMMMMISPIQATFSVKYDKQKVRKESEFLRNAYTF